MADAKRMKEEDVKRFEEQEKKVKIETEKSLEEFIEFIQDNIKNMEQELMCPVCLEVSEVPIFTCPSQHNICGKCYDKMRSEDPFCPQCRKPFPYPPANHRLMEKLAEQLKEAYAKLDKVLSSQ